jgi:hypothetical protein
VAHAVGDPNDECTLDDAWRYLTLVTGRADHVARGELLSAIRAGQLPIRCNGSTMAPEYWDRLTFDIEQGRLVVQPLHFALAVGEYGYTTSWRIVRMRWL